jgi:hypothetical protein
MRLLIELQIGQTACRFWVLTCIVSLFSVLLIVQDVILRQKNRAVNVVVNENS